MNKSKNIVHEIPRYLLLLALILSIAIFGAMRSTFLNITNMMDVLRTASVIGLLGISGVIIWSTGETNFAIGSQLTLASAVCGAMMAQLPPSNYALGVGAALLLTTLTGVVVCFFVVNLGVPSFIATLALSTALDGVNNILTNNTTLYSSNWGDVYTALGQSYLLGYVPTPVVVFAVVALISAFFMDKTRIGNYVTAVGANATASRQVGINVGKVKYIAFAVGSLLAGIAGILQTSISNNVIMKTGTDLLMPAICATVLSATFLTPGKYNVLGAVVASVLIIVLQNGVISVGGSFYTKDIIQGIVFIIAVGIIAVMRKGGLPSVKFES